MLNGLIKDYSSSVLFFLFLIYFRIDSSFKQKTAINNKQKVFEGEEKVVSGRTTSELFGISRQTVSDIQKQTPVLKQCALQYYVRNDNSSVSRKLTLKETKNERFESALLSWYLEQFRYHQTVRVPDLKAAADRLKKNYRITGLNCDMAWLSAFRQRCKRMANDKNLNELSPNQQTTSSQHYSSSTSQQNVESNKKRTEEEDDKLFSNPPVEVHIKEEAEILQYDDPNEGNGQKVKELVSSETVMFNSAKKGIDAVINYVGYSSDRRLWGYYRDLRIIREIITEEQKKIHGNGVQKTNPEFGLPNA